VAAKEKKPAEKKAAEKKPAVRKASRKKNKIIQRIKVKYYGTQERSRKFT